MDDDPPSVERLDLVKTGSTAADTQRCLTPRSIPPPSPPPARSPSSPSGSTVEFRVEAKRCGSSGSRYSRGGSRPTSSKQRPPSVVEEREPTAPLAAAVEEERPENCATVSDDRSAVLETEAYASEEAPVDRDSSQDKPPTSPPPAQPPCGSTVEVNRCGSGGGRSSRAGSRPTSSKCRSSSAVENPALVSEPNPAEKQQQDSTTTISDDSAATGIKSSEVNALEEVPIDRISLKAFDNQEDHGTTSVVTSKVNEATVDSTAEPQEKVQLEIVSEKSTTVETEPDNKTKVADDQKLKLEQEPKLEILLPKVNCQVEQEVVNSSEMVSSTGVVDDSVEERPLETTVQQPRTTSPTTESKAAECQRDQIWVQEKTSKTTGRSRRPRNTGSRRSVQTETGSDSPTTESEMAEIIEDDSANSLVESSSSLAVVRRLRDRVPTPGPRRTMSANEPGVFGSPRSPQIPDASLDEHAEEGENEVSALGTNKPSNRPKLRSDMKRFVSSSCVKMPTS